MTETTPTAAQTDTATMRAVIQHRYGNYEPALTHERQKD